MNRSAADWESILLAMGVRTPTAAAWGPVFSEIVVPERFSAGEGDILGLVPQMLWESSMLERMVENLNYLTPERICAVWPTRFPTLSDAQPYARNPEALANKVYGGRNGNKAPGDGWRYRGRGPLNVTFLNNYLYLRDIIGQDFDVLPELLEQPRFATEATCGWWEGNINDEILGDVVKMRRRVNGATLGVEHVIDLENKLKKAWA